MYSDRNTCLCRFQECVESSRPKRVEMGQPRVFATGGAAQCCVIVRPACSKIETQHSQSMPTVDIRDAAVITTRLADHDIRLLPKLAT